MDVTEADWPAYLSDFHAAHAGITEDVLEHAVDPEGRTAYDWAAEPVGAGRVLDLACGSAPIAARLPGREYLGLDLSAAELAVAVTKGVRVARADATRLPLADGSVDAVVLSMALMLVPLAPTLAEVGRVLRPGGLLVATVPHDGPLTVRDRLRYARLLLALRQSRLDYPNDAELAQPAPVLAAAGLRLDQDDARRFVCPPVDRERLLSSLYLPGASPDRLRAASRVVRRWDTGIGVPIRRLVATRT